MKFVCIVIIGIGFMVFNGNLLVEFWQNLFNGVVGVECFDVCYMGNLFVGVCYYDLFKYQKKKEVCVGMCVGLILIYCVCEVFVDSGVNFEVLFKDCVGIYIGCIEYGNVEIENEIYNILKFNYDMKYWLYYYNLWIVVNNLVGEILFNFGVIGLVYMIGVVCVVGNMGLIYVMQMLWLGEVDFVICGGVSESIYMFGIFVGFKL